MSSRRKALAWIGAIAVVAFLASGVVLLKQSGGSPSRLASLYGYSVADFRAQGHRETRPAPALTGEDLDGTPLALTDFPGKVVVVNIWGSWCGPCRREEPDLVSVARAYEKRGVQFLGIDVRDQRAAAKAFRTEFTVTYPSFYDDSAQLVFTLQVQAVPTTFIIDRQGRIFFRFTGAVDRELLGQALDAVLADQPAATPSP